METTTHHSARHRKNSGIPRGQPARSQHAPMNIGVLGLWHLGTVTAAGLATLGHRVVGLDFDESRVANLNKGVTPVFEPGLAELITRGLSSGNLRFSSTMRGTTPIRILSCNKLSVHFSRYAPICRCWFPRNCPLARFVAWNRP